MIEELLQFLGISTLQVYSQSHVFSGWDRNTTQRLERLATRIRLSKRSAALKHSFKNGPFVVLSKSLTA